jgi:hypothetical protein
VPGLVTTAQLYLGLGMLLVFVALSAIATRQRSPADGNRFEGPVRSAMGRFGASLMDITVAKAKGRPLAAFS